MVSTIERLQEHTEELPESIPTKALSVRSIQEGKVRPYSLDSGQVVADKYWYLYFDRLSGDFLSKLNWWLNQPISGFIVEGQEHKWIIQSYEQWALQLGVSRLTQERQPIPDIDKVGRVVRRLEQQGVLVTSHDINPYTKTYRAKAYRIDYWRLWELTGLNPKGLPIPQLSEILGQHLTAPKPATVDPESKILAVLQNFKDFVNNLGHECNKFSFSLEPAWLSNLQNCMMNPTNLQGSTCNCCTIYNNQQLIFQSLSNLESEKKEEKTVQQENIHPPTETSDVKSEKKYSGNSPSVEKLIHVTLNTGVTQPAPSREKFEWEAEVGKPFPDFVRWRASLHYKTQGDRWSSSALSNAAVEIIRKTELNPQAVWWMWQDFLEYAERSADTALAIDAAGMEPGLPSCFHDNTRDTTVVAAKLDEAKGKVSSVEKDKVFALKAATQAALPPAEETEEERFWRELRGKLELHLIKYKAFKDRPIFLANTIKFVQQTPGLVWTDEGPAIDPNYVFVPSDRIQQDVLRSPSPASVQPTPPASVPIDSPPELLTQSPEAKEDPWNDRYF